MANEAQSALDAAIKTGKDMIDIAIDMVGLGANILAGLRPTMNVTRLSDVINIENPDGEYVEGEVIDSDLVRVDIPNPAFRQITDRFNREDLPYVTADPEDGQPGIGQTTVFLLTSDEAKARAMIEQAADDMEHTYLIPSNDPGKLVNTVGDGLDHKVMTVRGIKQEDMMELAESLEREKVHYEFDLDGEGSGSMSILSSDEGKFLKAYKEVLLDRHMPEYEKVQETEAPRREGSGLAAMIASGKNPLTGKGLNQLTIYDKTNPDNRLEITPTGCSRIAYGEVTFEAASKNSDYKSLVSVMIYGMLAPKAVAKEEYEKLHGEYVREMKGYLEKTNGIRERLNPLKEAFREDMERLMPEAKALVEKEKSLELELKDAIERGDGSRYDIKAYRDLVEQERIELGTDGMSLTEASRRAQILGLMEQEDMERLTGMHAELDGKARELVTASQEAEEEIKKIKKPQLEEEQKAFFDGLDARFLRESRRKNEYRGIELVAREVDGELRLEASITADVKDLAPEYRREEAEAELREAYSHLNEEVKGLYVERSIETVSIDEHDLEGEVQEAQVQVSAIETKKEIAEADVGDIEPSGGDFE